MKFVCRGSQLVFVLLLVGSFSVYARQQAHWQRFGKEYVIMKYDTDHTKHCNNKFTGTIVSFPGGDGTYTGVGGKGTTVSAATQAGETQTSIRTGKLCYRYYQVSFYTWWEGWMNKKYRLQAGGYFSNNRDTPKKAATLVTQILHFIKNSGLNRGKKLIYVGSSYGALIGAAALDYNTSYGYRTFDSLVDRVIFVSGPAAGNLNNACDHVSETLQNIVDENSRSKRCTKNYGSNEFKRYENVVDTQKRFWDRKYLNAKSTNINIIVGENDVLTGCNNPNSNRTCLWPTMSFGVHDYLYHIFYPRRSPANSHCKDFSDEGINDADNQKYATCVLVPGTSHDAWGNYAARKLEHNTSKLVCKYSAIEGNLNSGYRNTCHY